MESASVVQAAGPIRAWTLRRNHDVGGISGTGVVAHAAELPAGGGRSVAFSRWASESPPPGHDKPVRQTSAWAHITDAMAVHGHGGHTQFVPLPICAGDPVTILILTRHEPRRSAPAIYADSVYAYGVQWPDRRVSLSIMGALSPVHAHFEYLSQAWESAEEWTGWELNGWTLATGAAGLWEGSRIVRPVYVPALNQDV